MAQPYRPPMKSEQAAFGERLRAALRQAGVSESPAELVKLLARYGGDSVTQQAVSGWLNGKSLPRQKNLRALAKMLRMAPMELQYGEEGGRKVREAQKAWKIGAHDQLAIDTFLTLPAPQRKLVRELIDELARGGDSRR